jgi:hypothetical protein
MHSPTKDVGLSVAGDTSVFVGGDPASGAGTDTGLDGTEVYTLSFDGEPHPQQGYHVKLTVHTPRSNGNDSKTKVFWVEPCQPTPGDTDTEDGDGVTPGTDDGTEPGSVEEETTPDSDIEVLGEEATDEDGDTSLSPAEAEAEDGDQADALAGAQADAQAGSEDGSVPTAVDAGDNGRSALDWVRSPLPLLVIALGAVLAAAALVTRRRTRVQAGE